MEHSRAFMITSWILRGVAAVILLQTLFFKFTGAKESIYIFSTLGLEPWGRIGSGVAELRAVSDALWGRFLDAQAGRTVEVVVERVRDGWARGTARGIRCWDEK